MFNLSSLAISIHAIGAFIWVGGMVFAYTVLRPSLTSFDPPVRLKLWSEVFSRFFKWVWIAVIALPISGYVLMFQQFGGFAGTPIPIHVMHVLGLIMIALFVYLFFAPYRNFKNAVKAGDWPTAAHHLNTMRRIIAINTILGLITVITGASARF